MTLYEVATAFKDVYWYAGGLAGTAADEKHPMPTLRSKVEGYDRAVMSFMLALNESDAAKKQIGGYLIDFLWYDPVSEAEMRSNAKTLFALVKKISAAMNIDPLTGTLKK